jgi:hypothetical protein
MCWWHLSVLRCHPVFLSPPWGISSTSWIMARKFFCHAHDRGQACHPVSLGVLRCHPVSFLPSWAFPPQVDQVSSPMQWSSVSSGKGGKDTCMSLGVLSCTAGCFLRKLKTGSKFFCHTHDSSQMCHPVSILPPWGISSQVDQWLQEHLWCSSQMCCPCDVGDRNFRPSV